MNDKKLTTHSELFIQSGKGSIKIEGPTVWLDIISKSQELFYHVPNCKIKTSKITKIYNTLRLGDKKNCFKIKNKSKQLIIDYGDVRLKNVKKNNKNIVMDLVWLFLPILEHSRQNNGQYLVHAAAIEYNHKGVIFFGDTLSGKTSLISTLGFKYNCKILATEHTLLGVNNIEGGTHLLEGYYDLKKEIPELPINKINKCDNNFQINLQKINKYKLKTKISMMFFVSISRDLKKTEVYEWTKRKTTLYLGEWLRWMILGSRSFLHDCLFQFPSLDTAQISKRRMQMINKWIKNGYRIYFIKGSANKVAQEIIKILDNNYERF